MATSDSNSRLEAIDPSPMDLAIQFLRDNPTEKATTAARIHHVNVFLLRTNIRRNRNAELNTTITTTTTINGGQNKILTEAQVKAVYKYVEDSYYGG